MKPLSVSELNHQVKSLLEATFLQISVCGEVSNCTHHTSGHIYFSLKDKDSSLKCVLFRGNAMRLKFKIQEGMRLIVFGGLSVYTPRGEYQLNCSTASPEGVGELTLAFEQLKKEYEKKGYFENKKPLPKFPQRVALITSSTGAVLQDMLKIAQRRWKLTHFTLFNTLVQGEGAKEAIAKNIAYADSLNFDCLVIARGGGSLEDLWAFNEPLVIEAIFQAKTPIISAIGHEPDIVLSDFVADMRAPTPSAAMEILLPDKNEWVMYLDSAETLLLEKIQRNLKNKQELLKRLEILLEKNAFFDKFEKLNHQFRAFYDLLNQKIQHKLTLCNLCLEPLKEQIHLKISQNLAQKRNHLHHYAMKLESKNPKNYQRVGYLYASSHKKPISDLSQIPINSQIELEDTKAKAIAKIIEVSPNPNV